MYDYPVWLLKLLKFFIYITPCTNRLHFHMHLAFCDKITEIKIFKIFTSQTGIVFRENIFDRISCLSLVNVG